MWKTTKSGVNYIINIDGEHIAQDDMFVIPSASSFQIHIFPRKKKYFHEDS